MIDEHMKQQREEKKEKGEPAEYKYSGPVPFLHICTPIVHYNPRLALIAGTRASASAVQRS